MSRCARRRHGIEVSRLFHKDKDDEWQELAVEDKRSSPADVAALRIDFSEWLRGLSSRVRRIAALLASGETTSAVAKLVGLTCGRISQVRRELWASWHAFHGESIPAAA
jgi:hypothetical protein